MPYKVRVNATFAAAHALRGYGGACERFHGHNFNVTVEVDVKTLNEIGISYDFKILRDVINNVVYELDHADLNSHPYFQDKNPTAENLARFIYEGIKDAVTAGGGRVAAVTVEESAKYAATFLP